MKSEKERVYDWLERRVGDDEVVLSIRSIELAERFGLVLDEAYGYLVDWLWERMKR